MDRKLVLRTCKNGVRQGDPLSSFLFCLVIEVLSRGIGNVVENRDIKPIGRARNRNVPSHTLFYDDIMVFYSEDCRSIKFMDKLLKMYAKCSYQVCNTFKSIIIARSMI